MPVVYASLHNDRVWYRNFNALERRISCSHFQGRYKHFLCLISAIVHRVWLVATFIRFKPLVQGTEIEKYANIVSLRNYC